MRKFVKFNSPGKDGGGSVIVTLPVDEIAAVERSLSAGLVVHKNGGVYQTTPSEAIRLANELLNPYAVDPQVGEAMERMNDKIGRIIDKQNGDEK